MNEIDALKSIDLLSFIIICFVILSAVVTIYEIICKFSEIIGKPVGAMKQRKADHDLLRKTVEDLKALHETHEEDTRQSIRHDKMIRDDLAALNNTVTHIAVSLDEMKKKDNETKVKELKDTLINYYNKYRSVGEWSKLEKDAFWELFEDYEDRGGDGFMHSIVEPVMRELREIE